ncbi:MAG TPA: SDR family oxidoreductase [Kofleriaceae bacterium]|jgi:3-oxoacyl-[acyl-carrier protein] reductase|nr:SDR family oxidoreductase [Kofleriaceae bacterium]
MDLGIHGRTAMVAVAEIPARRFGRPEELADAVAFLLSERAAYINGTSLQIDGGLLGSTF